MYSVSVFGVIVYRNLSEREALRIALAIGGSVIPEN